MVRAHYSIIAGGVLLAGLIAFFLVSQTEEARVKKRFAFLAEKIRKTPEESQLIAAAKANRIREVFAETCTIHAPAYSFSRDISSDELPTLALTARSQYAKISLKFHDFVIDFPGKRTAQVNVTAHVEGTLKTGELIEDLQELECTLQNIEDAWRLKEIEMVEVLRK